MESAPAGGDTNYGPAIIAVTVVPAAIAFICVIIRCYVRLRLTGGFWWDDGLIIASALVSIPGVAFNILSVKSGAGRHQFYLEPLGISDTLKWNTAYQLDNIPSVTLTKMSILLFILRIKNYGIIAWIVWSNMAVTIIINVIFESIIGTQCIPLQGLWDPLVKANCSMSKVLLKMGYAQGAFSGFTDLLITASPILILWNIQMATRKKVAVCGLMSLGLLATAANITRTVFISSLSSTDFTFDITGIVMAAVLEQNLGLVAACIPTLQPLFKQMASSVRSRLASIRTARDGNSRSQSRGLDQIYRSGTKDYNVVIGSEQGQLRKSDESNLPLHDLPAAQKGRTKIMYKQTFDVQYGERSVEE